MGGIFCSCRRGDRYSLVRGSPRRRLTQTPYQRRLLKAVFFETTSACFSSSVMTAEAFSFPKTSATVDAQAAPTLPTPTTPTFMASLFIRIVALGGANAATNRMSVGDQLFCPRASDDSQT